MILNSPRDLESEEEPKPLFAISMRRKAVLLGLAYFSAALLVLSSTHPHMADAYDQMMYQDPSEQEEIISSALVGDTPLLSPTTEQTPLEVPAVAQLEVVWNRTHGGNRSEHASSIIGTADGGFVVAGRRYVPGASSNIYLLRVDGEGEKVWEKTYGGVGMDDALGVVQSDDGGFVAAGFTDSPHRSDAYFLKVDIDGNMIWNRTYGGAGEEGMACIVESGDGGYMAAGWNSGHLYVLRLDRDGNLVWDKTYGSINSLDSTGIAKTGGGDYIAWGKRASFGTYLLRIDGEGNKTWEKTFHGTLAMDVVLALDGGFIVAGGDAGDVSLLKVDSEGNKIWQKTYSRNGSEMPACVVDSGDGGFIVGGSAGLMSEGPPTYEELPVGGAYLLKVDDEGEVVWEQECSFVETGLHHVNGIISCGPGEFVVMGARPYDPETRWDLFLLKIRDKS